MLDSLRDYSKTDALGILSQLASDFTSPDPLAQPERRPEPVNLHSPDVLEEIRRRLSLRLGDYSTEAKDKIVQFIADQISQIVLNGADERKIKARLADKDLLRPDLYEIRDTTSTYISDRGIRSNHIRGAINYSDGVEHLHIGTMPDGTDELSFFVHHVKGDVVRSFSLIVIAGRKGYELSIRDAVRVYPSDVDLGFAERPIDMFRAFLDVYGVWLKTPTSRSKLILLTSIEKPRLVGIPKSLIEIEDEHAAAFNSTWLMKDQVSTLDVGMAYLIDEVRYRSDLRKHGVMVKL